MKNMWSDRDVRAMVKHYTDAGVSEDVALRVYTTRLLGNEPRLVLHGGGNTSVKTVMKEATGEHVNVLCVKGSGWDMGNIEPPGLPAVKLEPIQRLAALDSLADEDMVNIQRCNLIDSTAPNPSVETLLHAFLPHTFIDHTHANAVLALTDQPEGEELCRDVYGARVGYVPYIMPGFALAKKAAEVFRENPDVEGLILLKHGIFSFGKSAKEAYTRMIDLVTVAERRIGHARRQHAFAPVRLPRKLASAADVAPILRGLTAIPVKPEDRLYDRWILNFRTGPKILAFVNGKDVARYSQQGTATPDHVIRTKHRPLILPAPEADKLEAFRKAVHRAITRYQADYHAYFSRNNRRQPIPKKELDRMPRVILVPGLGLFGLGNSAKAAKIAADLAETNVDVIGDAERMSRYQVISEADIFEIEYWSLEQAKLGKGKEPPLARQVVVITGGASGIGAAAAKAFAREGAEVAVLDRDELGARKVAGAVKGLGLRCDVTKPDEIRAAFDAICRTYGGVDIVVSNAGVAWQGRIGEIDEALLRESFEINFFSHQAVAKEAVRIMRTQGLGGCLLFNISKQALNPGLAFGPYGLPKAATLALMRQYALDYGEEGIRANGVNADRIRTGLLTDDLIRTRAKARGLSEHDYMAGNLLQQEVTAADVAKAFVDLALARKTTAALLTVDGGNMAAAVR